MVHLPPVFKVYGEKIKNATRLVNLKTMEMMLDKKQIQAIFLVKFKMGHKAAELETTAKHLAQELLMNVQCSGGSRSFAKEMRALKMRSTVEVDNNQLRAIIEADPLKTTREVTEELNVDQPMVVQHLKQIGKVKKLEKWVPHELTENQKIIILKCHLLLSCATENHFSIRL
ncbi:histone-lysine N-methyltransferase SETMAR-like isoform X1 [Lemur catta]|uniref:histone-lysine N-methyltransferase SETMAR-like isoform X1 n=1 Tax=Lemur catta TaxID=9447 RepID=UPI001E26D2E5|nr:histone-lysine N-methyltransferase SETMAR-like isoform X1 [Lemur catta]